MSRKFSDIEQFKVELIKAINEVKTEPKSIDQKYQIALETKNSALVQFFDEKITCNDRINTINEDLRQNKESRLHGAYSLQYFLNETQFQTLKSQYIDPSLSS